MDFIASLLGGVRDGKTSVSIQTSKNSILFNGKSMIVLSATFKSLLMVQLLLTQRSIKSLDQACMNKQDI